MNIARASEGNRFSPFAWGILLALALLALWPPWPRIQSAAWVNLGTVELRKALVAGDIHNTARAEKYLAHAAKAGSGRAYRNLAWIPLASGQAEPAVELLAQADVLDAGDESAYWQLGQLYWRQNQVMEAAEVWKRVVRGEPDRLYSILWTLMGAEGPKSRVWEAMIELGHDAIARDPTPVFPYRLLGMMYRHVGYEVSNQWFQEALRRSPGDVTVLTELAANAIRQKNFAQARSYLSEALSRDDGEARLYFLMAQTYDEEGRAEAAVHWYGEALTRDPRPEYHYALAALYDRSSQYDLALAEYEAVLEHHPDEAKAQTQVERLRRLINGNHRQK